MVQRPTSKEHSFRALLSRHPVAVECVQTVADVTRSLTEIVVFEDGRGFVVASSSSAVMQPRRLSPAEATVAQGQHRVEVDQDGSSYAIVGADGTSIGALTVHGEIPAHFEAAIRAQARVMSLIVGLETRDATADDAHASAILNGLRDAVVVLDRDLNMQWVNRASGSLIGRSPADVVGRPATDFLHPDDVEPTLNAILRLNDGLEMYRIRIRILRPDGNFEAVDVTGLDHGDDPAIGGIVLSLRAADIDETTLLRERSDRMADAIVGGLSDGVVATDQFGVVTLVNDVARDMFELDSASPPASFRLSDFAVVDHAGVSIDVSRDDRLEFARSFDLGLRVDTPSTALRHLTINRMPVADSGGEELGSVVVFRDVTALKDAAASLRHQALHDQLTGLPNRRQLEERVLGLESEATPTNIAACFIDLDGFKLINDNHGHSTGDQLIKVAAQRLETVLRRGDLLVRQGGDEFVALQIGANDADEVLAVAERLRNALARPFTIDDRRFDVTASIGVAMATSDSADVETLLQQADIALYAAKTRGRNRVETFDQALADAVAIEAEQQQFLRDALREERLVMHFQPLVTAHSEEVHGYEALARVQMPDGDIVGPARFLATHLPADLMYAFDSAAFDLSCTAAAELERATLGEAPYVSCNLSAATLAHPGLVSMILDTVERHEITSTQICLEVTESAAFSSGDLALESLTTLHSAGFRVALDDFGTGYSSLVHLRDLPIDVVKVDRSFVIRLADHGSERAIVTAITALARNLGLGIVAEGVETAEHLENAEQIGFDTMQGWYYAKAMPLGEVLAPHLADATR